MTHTSNFVQSLKAALASGLLFFTFGLSQLPWAKAASEPTLTIQAGDQTRTFTRDQLLEMAQVQNVVVEKDPEHPKLKMTYRAVPLAILFDGVKLEATNTLLFKCLDGFSAPISVTRVLNRDPKLSRAFLAIEPKDDPKSGSKEPKWPIVKDGKTAGPFYVVWENPRASHIGTEEWPYQVISFEVKPPFDEQFPLIKPDSKLSEIDPVRRGYLAFQKTCFACHTLNGQGASHMGPDLNLPLSPTEYFKPGMIEKLVRNPQRLRQWPESKMPALDKTAISDRDLENVVAYLKHMSHRKPKIEK
ncbi:cytochrome c [soil metagenome]